MPDEQLRTARLEIEALDDANDDELMCMAACSRRARYSFFCDAQGPEWPVARVTFLCPTHAAGFVQMLNANDRVRERLRSNTA